MIDSIFEGIAVAFPSFFVKGGKVDYTAIKKHAVNLQNSGIKTLVLYGSTGEAESLTYYEKRKIYETVKDHTDCKIILGVGKSFTRQTVSEIKKYSSWDINGLLVITPYLNKCDDNGLKKHYKTVSVSTDLPIIIYNVPSRTGINVKQSVLNSLYGCKNIVGIKQADGNGENVEDFVNGVKNRFYVYSGDDTLNGKFFFSGASGSISVTANVFPKALITAYGLCKSGNFEKAKHVFDTLKRFDETLFKLSNPIPVKSILSYLGYGDGSLRLPLLKADDGFKKLITDAYLNTYKELNYD